MSAPTRHALHLADKHTAGQMDAFEAAYWNQLQLVLWVCRGSRGAVRLASGRPPPAQEINGDRDNPPGFENASDIIADVLMPGGRIGRRWRSRLHKDLSLESAEEQVLDALVKGRLRGSGLRNGEGDRQRIPQEQWADLQFYWSPPLQGLHLSSQWQSGNLRRGYVGPRDRTRANATFWTEVGFEREEVLALWPDSVRDPLRAKTGSLKLAEAVTTIAYGRELTSVMLGKRRRQRHRGCSPPTSRRSSTRLANGSWR